MATPRTGTVFLVGAGPGDPGLLTLRAAELVRDCDCLVFDYLVNPEIVALAPAAAERHDVGKRGGQASTTQAEINAALVRLAASHRRVVRLKGGDPFLFGRGGEEAQALAEAGIPFEVVPGVTAGVAVPAYAGIPITHRAASSAVVFATGHQQPGKDEQVHWDALARVETLVLYMGMHRLGEICASLIANGRAATTPACVIQWGTYPRQRVVEGTLATLAAAAKAAGLGAPAITVVGDVVRYRDSIRWFDNRPLCGRTVVVTRSREQASGLARLLAASGARVIECPLLRQEPPASWQELDAALGRLGSFTWVAFTSANAVRFTLRRLRELGRDARAFAGCRIAAVGRATAEALEQAGLVPDLVPESFSGEALAKEILRAAEGPLAVLLPQADNAVPAVRERLLAAGAAVTTAIAYRNLPDRGGAQLAAHVAAGERIDAVAFASSATAQAFANAQALADADNGLVATLAGSGCRFYAIGPETAAGMARAGIPCTATAAEASVEGLAEAIIADLGPGTGTG